MLKKNEDQGRKTYNKASQEKNAAYSKVKAQHHKSEIQKRQDKLNKTKEEEGVPMSVIIENERSDLFMSVVAQNRFKNFSVDTDRTKIKSEALSEEL